MSRVGLAFPKVHKLHKKRVGIKRRGVDVAEITRVSTPDTLF